MSLTIASQWFQMMTLPDGVRLFLETHVDPWLRANIWHVSGRDRDLIVDTGMGLGSLRAALGALRERPVLAVASHAHFDHMGGHYEFSERACHRLDGAIMSAPDVRNTVANLFINESCISALPHAGYDLAHYAVRPAPPTRLLESGEVIDLGDRAFEVLHLPGHAPGAIALLERATGILFSGDVVYDGELIDSYPTSSSVAYRESMSRLMELPVSTVHAGHYGSFGRERMRAIAQDYMAHGAPPFCPTGKLLLG